MTKWTIKLVGCWLFSTLIAVRAHAAAGTGTAVPALVTLSGGTVQSGELQVIGARPLTIVPIGEERQRMFLLSDMVLIEQALETASMQRPWVFKESGRAEKTYAENEYPLLNFQTRITLVNGSVVTGHLISVVMTFKTEEGRKKLFLQRQIKGTLEQKVTDIAYTHSIRFTGNLIEGGGIIAGRVEGFGQIVSVTALDNEREQILIAKVIKDNCFDFGTVLPGRYDLCVFTDTHVLTGHSNVTPGNKTGAALQEGDQAAINVNFARADDFFNDRWILQLRGHRGFAKALIYKRRSDYYEAERWTPGGFLWHLEVWSWHFAEPDWKVHRRNILIRHKQQGGEQNRKLMTGQLLDAVVPGQALSIQAKEGKEDEWQFIRDLN